MGQFPEREGKDRIPVNRAIVYSFLLVVFSLIALLPSEVKAQSELRARYPKYRFYGLIELTYLDYSTARTDDEQKLKSEASSFQQRYKLGAVGFIIHPKLALYSADVTFRHATTKQGNGEDSKATERELGYSLFMRLLPQRPYSLDVYASRSTGTVSSEPAEPYDITSNTYGLTLRLSLKDLPFLKSKKAAPRNGNGNDRLQEDLPSVTLQYNHWDYDSDRSSGRAETDRYGIDIKGRVKAIRTRYGLVYEFVDYSRPGRSYDSQYLRATTDTILSRGKSLLTTSFQYASVDISRYANFTAELSLTPTERFSHDYSYAYYHFETGPAKSDSHNVRGTWGYTFTNRIFGRGTAFYGITTSDGEREDGFGTAAALHYGADLNSLDFSSTYRFAYRDMSEAGEVIENNLELGLRTRKLKWGTIYSNYSFTHQTTSNQGKLIEHIFRTGVRGRGPGRAFWNVEGEYDHLTNDMDGALIILPGGPEALGILGAGKTSFYSLTAEAGYPLGRRGLVTVKGNYTSGTADSKDFSRYYYEARLNYRLLRNLAFVGWFREGLDRRIETAFDRKVREYEGRLYYRLRRVFLSAEYKRWTTEEGPVTTEVRRLYLKLTRPI